MCTRDVSDNQKNVSCFKYLLIVKEEILCKLRLKHIKAKFSANIIIQNPICDKKKYEKRGLRTVYTVLNLVNQVDIFTLNCKFT